MSISTPQQRMYYTLRIASAMCFIGHGAFGIITKQVWCNYFAVFGMGHATAFTLMPLVGTIDILMGIILLVYPLQLVVLWLVLWGVITAFLRPLSDEPFAEFIERAGNFGAPLSLLILSGSRINITNLFRQVKISNPLSAKQIVRLTNCLRVVVFLLLLGHGWLNTIEKKSLMDQYSRLGFESPESVAYYIGLLEIIAAASILIHPVKSIVLTLLIWKAASELFYPHYELFEWIERGGSYGTLLALYFALHVKDSFSAKIPFEKSVGFTRPQKQAKYASPHYNIH